MPLGRAPWPGGRSCSLYRPWSVPVLDKSNLAQIYVQRCSLQKSLFTFLLAVTQPHDALVAQNCKCSVLNYCCSFDWHAEWKLQLIWFYMKYLLHLSVSNWVDFVCTQGLLVLLPLYHSGIVLRSPIVPRVCSLIDTCVCPTSSNISVFFSAKLFQAMPTKKKNPSSLHPAISSQALM